MSDDKVVVMRELIARLEALLQLLRGEDMELESRLVKKIEEDLQGLEDKAEVIKFNK